MCPFFVIFKMATNILLIDWINQLSSVIYSPQKSHLRKPRDSRLIETDTGAASAHPVRAVCMSAHVHPEIGSIMAGLSPSCAAQPSG